MREQIDKYVLVHRIERGSSGSVWLAHRADDATTEVALKLFSDLRPDDEASHEQFLQEASALARLSDHPHIIRILEYGVFESTPWIAMEHASRSLREEMSEGPLEPERLHSALLQLAEALDTLQRLDPPMVHNDLKPENVLVGMSGELRLADFGLARYLGSARTLSFATIRYAAPESLDTSLGEPSTATDLYSLGHIAYEMALGPLDHRKQFAGVCNEGDASGEGAGSPMQWMAWHCSLDSKVPSLEQIMPDFPMWLSAIIEKLMAKSRDDRYQSAGEVLADLRERTSPSSHARAVIIEPKAADTGSRKSRFSRYRSVAIVAVLVFASVGAFLVPSRPPELKLDASTRLVTKSHQLQFTGTALRLPADAVIRVMHDSMEYGQVEVARAGTTSRFRVQCELTEPGTCAVDLEVVRDRKPVARLPLLLERKPPEQVQVSLQTSPPLANAQLQARTSGRELAAQTGEDGKVTLALAPGTWTVSLRHPEAMDFEQSYDTGFEESRTWTIPVAPSHAELQISAEPHVIGLVLKNLQSGREFPTNLTEDGKATARLPIARYAYAAQAEHGKLSGEIDLRGGAINRLDLRSPASAPLVRRALPGADAMRLVSMSEKERLAQLRELIPLKGMEIDVSVPIGKPIRVSGKLANDQELHTLRNRLQGLDKVVDSSEVKVDPDFLSRRMEGELRAQGFPWAEVRPQSGTGRLLVRYRRSDTTSQVLATAIAAQYVFDMVQVRLDDYTDLR